MSAIIELLSQIAPTIATALGGPLAGMAEDFIASKLGIDPKTVQQTLAGMKPEDLIKMKELETQFKIHLSDNGIKLNLAQIEVNKTEAASTNWFVAGWRPGIGWICATAFGYTYVILPFLMFLVYAFGTKNMADGLSHLPHLDMTEMMPVLLGMLGLSWNRTDEKKAGVQDNH